MKKEIETWITVNGARIPIFKGQSTADAVKTYVDRNSKKGGDKMSPRVKSYSAHRAQVTDFMERLDKAKTEKENYYRLLGEMVFLRETFRQSFDEEIQIIVLSFTDLNDRQIKCLNDNQVEFQRVY